MSKKLKKRQTEIIIIFLLFLGCIILYLAIFMGSDKKTKIVDEISEYGYTLDDRDTKLMKSIFTSLEKELNKNEINYEAYAEYLAKLFVIDVYTINNKIDMYDVGGLEYIHESKKSEFKTKMRDTLYRFLANEKDRKEEMPEVAQVEVTSQQSVEYEYNDKIFEAYKVELNWEYQKELGYDKKGSIVLIKEEGLLYVASFTPEVLQ